MKKLHKITAWLFGIWLAVICVTGSLLLYKNDILGLMYPSLAEAKNAYIQQKTSPYIQTQSLAVLVESLIRRQPDTYPTYQYVIFASDNAPWHLVVDSEANMHYFFVQDNTVNKALVRESLGDWLDVVRQLHMHLVMHDMGEDALGVLAIVSIILIVAGLTVWWPRRFSKRLFKLPLTRNHAKTYRQWHTLTGLGSLPLLGIVIISSLSLLYNAQFRTVLVEWIDGTKPHRIILEASSNQKAVPAPWHTIFSNIRDSQPTASLRILSLQLKTNQPIQVRFKLPHEWHPNGRSLGYFNPANGAVLKYRTADEMKIGETLLNMFYPLHIAAVGGFVYLLLMTLTGLAPMFLFYWGYKLSKLNTAKMPVIKNAIVKTE